MNNLNISSIVGKSGVISKELNSFNEIDHRTQINFELGNTVLNEKEYNADDDEIQGFFSSKAKLFEPNLFYNKNNKLKNTNMNSIDVKKIRLEFELTQQGFANFIGVDRRTVVNWEKGNKIPDSKVKLFELLMEGKRNATESVPQEAESKPIPSADLNREILELKDHIKTLKDFLEEKNKLADMYRSENAMLKEKLDRLT
jgi:DNA-binding transcriptional regulator YiaG